MEPMKQCPHCGKYVAANRTYCMNCNTTLAIRCPACQKILPLGTKVCTACKHSFVRKTKRKAPPFLQYIRRHPHPILCALTVLAALAVLILYAMPSLYFALTSTTSYLGTTEEWSSSAYTLIRHFLGAHPATLSQLLALSAFEETTAAIGFTLYGMGAGYLIAIVATLLALLLVCGNLRHAGPRTTKRLFSLTLVALGGHVLALGMDLLSVHLMRQAAALTWPQGLSTTTILYTAGTRTSLWLCLVSLLWIAALVYLYVDIFRKQAPSHEEERHELSLSRMIRIPLSAMWRGCLHLARRRKSDDAEKHPSPKERTVVCTKRFTSFMILLGVALIFTQALLSKISNIFFWFLVLLPPLLILYVLLAKVSLTAQVLSESTTTEKNCPYTYEVSMENHSLLAFPFIEARVSLPQSNSVRCSERSIRLAMAPLSSYHIKNTVHFRFRGTYDIGVQSFYVYDFFRIFRVQVPIESMTTVNVLPRRLSVQETVAQSIADNTVRTVRSPLVVDRLEVSDIRDYQAGDSLKSIHWKLSSKSESFIVKDYNTGTSNQTVIFCDLAAHFPDEPPSSAPTPPPEAQAQRKLSRKERAAKRRAEQDKQRLDSLRRHSAQSPETKDMSDQELETRLAHRATIATRLSGDLTQDDTLTEVPGTPEEKAESLDVHALDLPAYYDDMNEYMADGVVELTIANVLSELNQGHEVLLIWFDRRSDMGVFAYSLRGVDEFERIYTLFGTAPLCAKEKSVELLTAMVSDTESSKQLFVLSTLDQEMMNTLIQLPGISDAANFGSAEALLYNPEERFRYPRERALYLEGCREQLAASGVSLMVSNTKTSPDYGNSPYASSTSKEGGPQHES